ncbi:MAG: hypothetical protein V2I62_12575 [Bacteroidales bacterium]|jgi:hypothetical protein|nr:hypothetical protein [Bacteroidales bacterium]
MKNQITIAAVLLITLFLLISLSGMGQEDKKEKQVTVKRVEVENGKKVVKDTTFTIKEGEKVNEIVESISWMSDGDSTRIRADISMDDEDVQNIRKVIVINKDGDEEIVEEIIVHSDHKGPKKVMKFKTDDGEEVVVVLPRGHHKAAVWHSDDDFEFEFDVDQDVDFEFNAKEFEAQLEAHLKELEDARVIVLDEEMELLEEMEGFEDMEIEMIRKPRPPKHPYFERRHIERFEQGVTDKELRDAGIKNKPDRLEIEELDIDNNDGIITLQFTIPGDASPKVEVYNFFGDEVFSSKPEVVNGSYKLVMDLSQKQHGTYYLQIINKNSSLTEKIRL